jgi:hypothetical protein
MNVVVLFWSEGRRAVGSGRVGVGVVLVRDVEVRECVCGGAGFSGVGVWTDLVLVLCGCLRLFGFGRGLWE